MPAVLYNCGLIFSQLSGWDSLKPLRELMDMPRIHFTRVSRLPKCATMSPRNSCSIPRAGDSGVSMDLWRKGFLPRIRLTIFNTPVDYKSIDSKGYGQNLKVVPLNLRWGSHRPTICVFPITGTIRFFHVALSTYKNATKVRLLILPLAINSASGSLPPSLGVRKPRVPVTVRPLSAAAEVDDLSP